jgi:hypothetical protein
MEHKVHYRVLKSPPPVAILNQINSVHSTPSQLTKTMLILFTQLRLGFVSGFIPSGFPTNTL